MADSCVTCWLGRDDFGNRGAPAGSASAGSLKCRRDNPSGTNPAVPYPAPVTDNYWCGWFTATDPHVYVAGITGPTGPIGSSLVATFSLQAPVDGFSITMPDATEWLILNPAAPLPTGPNNITLPPNPVDGQIFRIKTSKTIDNLNILPNAGQSMNVAYALGTLAGYVYLAFTYRLSDTTWY